MNSAFSSMIIQKCFHVNLFPLHLSSTEYDIRYTHCISCESKTPSLNIFLIILFNVCFLIRKHLKIKFKLQQKQSRQSYCKFGLLIYSRTSDKTEFFAACITTKRLIGVLDYLLSGTKI